MSGTPYGRSARAYDALTAGKDYAGASQAIRRLVDTLAPRAERLLDVACGTGRHLVHLREHFKVEGLDRSPDMLAVARRRCPGIRFHEGRLTDFQLRATFDVVTCLFGSIGHCTTAAALRRAIRNMARHVEPGGLLIVEPWIAPERFVEGRLVLDVADTPDLKVARMYITRRRARTSVFEMDYVIGTSAAVECFRERQILGLFTGQEYVSALEAAGLSLAESGDLFGYGLFVCRMGANDSVVVGQRPVV